MNAAQLQLLGYGIIGDITRAIDAIDRAGDGANEVEIGKALGEIHDARAHLQTMHNATAKLNPKNL